MKGQPTTIAPGQWSDWVSEYTGIYPRAAEVVIEKFLTHVLDQLDQNQTVMIQNFGKFEKRVWHQKSVYNFKTKQPYRKDVTVIYFTPADNVTHIRLNGHTKPRRPLKVETLSSN